MNILPLSVQERTLLHLYGIRKLKDDYMAPFAATQDGVGEALGVSRAHAAVDIKKLKERGLVTVKYCHIVGGKVQRKAFFLTPAGEEMAIQTQKMADREGIKVEELKLMSPNKFVMEQTLSDRVMKLEKEIAELRTLVMKTP